MSDNQFPDKLYVPERQDESLPFNAFASSQAATWDATHPTTVDKLVAIYELAQICEPVRETVTRLKPIVPLGKER